MLQWLYDTIQIGKLAWHFAPILWQREAFFRDDRNADLLVRLLSARGAFFLKLGQWLGQRPDIVPPSFCAKLKHLQTNAPRHSWQDTCATFGGIDLHQYMTFVDRDAATGDPMCLSSGSIAQVYRVLITREKLQQFVRQLGADRTDSGMYWRAPSAYVEPNGGGGIMSEDDDTALSLPTQYILKVCHPNVAKEFGQSLRTVTQIYNAIKRLSGSLSAVHLVDMAEVAEEMHKQCNLMFEARNGATFQRNFASNRYVRIPQICLASSDFLVEQYITDALFYDDIGRKGVDPFHYYDSDEARQETRLLAKQITMAAFFQMIMHDGFAHGDCHSGNILYKLFPKSEQRYRQELAAAKEHDVEGKPLRVAPVDIYVCFLDFGVAVKIDENTRKAMLELTISINANDAMLMVHAFERVMVNLRQHSRSKLDNFEQDCIETSKKLQEHDLKGSGSSFQDQMMMVLENFRIHQLRVEAGALRVIIGWMLIDENSPVKGRCDNLPDNTIRWVLHEDTEDNFCLHELTSAVLAARTSRYMAENELMRQQSGAGNSGKNAAPVVFKAPDLAKLNERKLERQQQALSIVEVLELAVEREEANNLKVGRKGQKTAASETTPLLLLQCEQKNPQSAKKKRRILLRK